MLTSFKANEKKWQFLLSEKIKNKSGQRKIGNDMAEHIEHRTGFSIAKNIPWPSFTSSHSQYVVYFRFISFYLCYKRVQFIK